MELNDYKPFQALTPNQQNTKMKKLRACPICPKCGSKKFERLKSGQTKVRCLSCNKIITI